LTYEDELVEVETLVDLEMLAHIILNCTSTIQKPIALRLLIPSQNRYFLVKSFQPSQPHDIKNETYELALLEETLLEPETLDEEVDEPDVDETLVTVPLTLDWDDTLEETETLDDWLEVGEVEVAVPEIVLVEELDTDTDPETEEEPLMTVPEDVEEPEMGEVIHVVTNLEMVLVT
jgi:hypothetical protein